MKVAVPWLKHSPRFGQSASSHTELRRRSRRIFLIRVTPGPVGARARIQAGLRRAAAAGSTLTGMRASLAAPR